MAHCTKQSTTYKRDFELEPDVIVKLGLTLPFTLTEAQVDAILGEMVEAIDRARMEVYAHQSRLWEREPVGAGRD